ncbi:MAG: archaellin/type IV pilin N-terminal domain-containing protein [Thermoplasmata archaeon]
MKKHFLEGERAVSPVVAIILLVAITVVLSATLYTMLEPDEDVADLLVGDLSVHRKDRTEDKVVLTLHMQRPSSAYEEQMHVDVLDPNGTLIDFDEEENSCNWTYSPGDDGRIRDGSRLTIVVDGADNFRHYEVIILVDGYPGTIKHRIT